MIQGIKSKKGIEWLQVQSIMMVRNALEGKYCTRTATAAAHIKTHNRSNHLCVKYVPLVIHSPFYNNFWQLVVPTLSLRSGAKCPKHSFCLFPFPMSCHKVIKARTMGLQIQIANKCWRQIGRSFSFDHLMVELLCHKSKTSPLIQWFWQQNYAFTFFL